MKRRLFYVLSSSMRSRRFAFAASCLLLLAVTPKPTLADSGNPDAAIESDGAEPTTFADGQKLMRPVRVESTSGQVSNAEALVAGHHGFATLTWGGVGSAPMIILDYGRDVGGIPVFDVVSV